MTIVELTSKRLSSLKQFYKYFVVFPSNTRWQWPNGHHWPMNCFQHRSIWYPWSAAAPSSHQCTLGPLRIYLHCLSSGFLSACKKMLWCSHFDPPNIQNYPDSPKSYHIKSASISSPVLHASHVLNGTGLCEPNKGSGEEEKERNRHFEAIYFLIK